MKTNLMVLLLGVDSDRFCQRVKIDQNEMNNNIFVPIIDTEYVGKILLIYLHSLLKNKIAAQDELSRLIIIDLVKHGEINVLQQILNCSLLSESKPLACFLLSLSNLHESITQMALDILSKISANEIILEVLLGQGKVIDALRLAKQLNCVDTLSARKYLEAAQKSNNLVLFHSVYNFFQQRNLRLRNSLEFSKSEQCNEYVQQYHSLFKNQTNTENC